MPRGGSLHDGGERSPLPLAPASGVALALSGSSGARVDGGSRCLAGATVDHGRDRRGEPWPTQLPRKEVIQPQLPLRLPCYDFVPVTNPTLGGCVPEGFTHRLQVLPAPMT